MNLLKLVLYTLVDVRMEACKESWEGVEAYQTVDEVYVGDNRKLVFVDCEVVAEFQMVETVSAVD